MSDRTPLDPFGPTANPQLYVPRVATERALDQLASLVGPEKRGLVLLTGPPGLGKTQLLRMLTERLPRGTEPLYLPIGSLPIGDLCAYALSLLGISDIDDAEARLLEVARESAARGRRLVLLCDDASALGASASKLAALVAEAAGALAAVLASDDARAGTLRSSLGPGVPEVSLSDPMTAAETARYVRVRLAEAEISPALWKCFDRPALERIHLESKGVPRCVNQEAGALLHDLANRTLNAHQEPAPAEVEGPPLPRTPDAATPTPRPEEPPIPPLRASRVHKRRYRMLRVVELGLASLVAALVVLLVLRSRMPPPLESFDSATRPPTSNAGETPSLARGENPPTASQGEAAPAGAPPAAPEQPGKPPPAQVPSVSAGPPPATPQAASPERPAAPPDAPAALPSPPPGPASPPPAPSPAPAPPPATSAPPPGVASGPPQPAPAAPAPPSEAGREPTASPQSPAEAGAPASPAAVSASPTVSVNVNADPWARVEIDGKAVGVTPLAGVSLSPGDHVFRATLPDGRVIERTVRIEGDSRFVHFP